MARLVGHAGCVSSVEWLDEVGRGFGVVRLFCGVGDADGDVLLVVVDGAGDGAVVGVVDDGVAYQVVHSEREVARVRLDEGAVVCGESVGVDAQVTCLCLFAVGFERVAYDAGGVHGFRAGVGHGLDAGEFEQTVDEFTAFAVRFDGVADGWFDVLGEPVLGHERFEAGADGRDRCFQFVAGVADERSLQFVGLLDAVEHRVERVG